MENHIVMKTGELTTPNAPIAVSTLAVTGVGQTLAHSTPLHGEVVVVVKRSYFVNAPTERAVVEYHAGDMSVPYGIRPIVDIFLLSASHPYEADDVIFVRHDGVVAQRDTGIGCGLSEDGGVLPYLEIARQRDDTPHIKHDYFLDIATDGSA